MLQVNSSITNVISIRLLDNNCHIIQLLRDCNIIKLNWLKKKFTIILTKGSRELYAKAYSFVID